MTHLYVTEDDFRAYAEFSTKLAKAAAAAPELSTDKKVMILKHATEVLTQVAFVGEVDKNMVHAANTMVTDAIQLVSENEEALLLLTNLAANGNPLYAHSVAVSMFASLIAQKFDWKASPTLNKVAMAGLFHDAGKRELVPSLLTRKRTMLSPDEIVQIETHPSRGRELNLQMAGIPEEVAQAALEHHEKMDGTGYPRHLKGEMIHPLARLIHLADRFVGYVMPMTEGAPKLEPKEAIRKIASLHLDEVDKNFFVALAQIFKMKDVIQIITKSKVA